MTVYQFIVLIIVQALFINGLHIAFKGYIDEQGKKHGNILFMLVSYRTFGKDLYWTKPLWDCIKCMSSVWGTVSFFMLYTAFGFNTTLLQLCFLWVIDVVALAYLSYLLYKIV